MKTRRWFYFSVLALLGLIVLPTMAFAAQPAPFVGQWQAIDIDGSDIRLTIGGPPEGPFRITWTENYISFCDGEAGIVRGTGMLNEMNAYLLEADLQVMCFTTRASMDFHMTFRYHPTTNTLSARYEGGPVVIWHRPGLPPPPPPELGLRVNCGHEWVESFYEAGHTVWISVMESDGVTVKATAEMFTEPQDFWDGETGFQTRPEDWLPAPPDIQPNDWVYGWVDNGASAQVQIGEISGTIDLQADSVRGAVLADWFAEELYVICDPWGLDDPSQYRESSVYPDGVDEYECSWSEVLDIQAGQELGVWYYGPDGHAVVNAFSVPLPSFAAYMPSTIEGYDWPMGDSITLYVNGAEYFAQAVSEQRPDFPEGTTRVLFELWRDDFSLEAGDYIVMADEASGISKELWVANLEVTDINVVEHTVSGIYEPNYSFWIQLDGQEPLGIQFQENSWIATFTEMPPGAWGTVAQDDADHDGTVWDFFIVNPEIRVWLGNQRIEGYQWPYGEIVSLTVYDPTTGLSYQYTQQVNGDPEASFLQFLLADFELQPGQEVALTGGGFTKIHTILPVSITSVDVEQNLVAGTASSEGRVILCIYEGGCDPPVETSADASGTWQVDYGDQFDIQPGYGMDATEFDEDGDGTSFDYWIPDPGPAVFSETE